MGRVLDGIGHWPWSRGFVGHIAHTFLKRILRWGGREPTKGFPDGNVSPLDAGLFYMAFCGTTPGSRNVASAPAAIGMPPGIALASVFPREVPPGLFPALVVVGRPAGGQLLLVFGRLCPGAGR